MKNRNLAYNPNFKKRSHHTQNTRKKKNCRKKFPLWQSLVLLTCVPTFFASTFLFCRDFLRYRTENTANAELAQKIQQIRSCPESSFSDKFTEYEALWEQNHDFAGWLFVDGTRIDYPVMHTPDDPEYYLHRAFDRSEAESGSLFIDGDYSMDGNSLLIYGHNMKDNSMFGTLTDYQSYDFALAHPVIYFDTLTEERTYELLAAFYWKPTYNPEEGPFLYYEYPDLSSREIFDDYIRRIKSQAIYDTGVITTYGDHILTLSTCSYHADNGRFVVVAVSH